MERNASERRWLMLLCAPLVILAWRFWFLCDDAFITFRYSRHLVRGMGLRFNRGDDPIEGYSNFLWMLVAALPELVGLDPSWVLPWISAACGLVLLWRTWVVARDTFGLSPEASLAGGVLVAGAPAMGVWATSGLETMPFALLFFLCFETAVLGRGPRAAAGAAASCVALVLMRPEGIGWVGVIAALALGVRLMRDPVTMREALRAIAPWLAAVIVASIAYELWRLWVFGDWVPNTARAKVGFTGERLLRGLKYLGLYYLTFPVHLLMLGLAPFAIRRRPPAGIATSLLALGPPVWSAVMGGDHFPMGRMLVPGLPFAGLLVACTWEALVTDARRVFARRLVWVALILGMLPAWDLQVTPYRMRARLHFRLSDTEFQSETARWNNMVGNTNKFILRGKALNEHAVFGQDIVGRAIGAMGYYSDLYIHDLYGLVNREVALQPVVGGPLEKSPGHDKEVSPTFFAKYDPDYLFARYVQGRAAAIHMQDSLDRWEVPKELTSRYVPEFLELPLDGERERGFLFLVRRKRPHEHAGDMWAQFERLRKQLHKDLGRNYLVDPRGTAPQVPAGEEDEDEEEEKPTRG